MAASKHYNFHFDPAAPLKDYTSEQKNFLLYGINFPDFVKTYHHIKPPKKAGEGNFEGIIPPLLNLYKKNPLNPSSEVKKYIIFTSCTKCHNSCLSRLGRETTIAGKTILDITKLNLNELREWITNLNTSVTQDELPILQAFSTALQQSLSNLIEVGLDYLTLDRPLPSLSLGESQRVKLAGIVGSGLTGILYVLDEPTTGLHPHDTAKLLKTIRMIQEAGNTVLIIEHDTDVIQYADYILEVGPEGGSKGGTIIAHSTPTEIINNSFSLISRYLSKKIALNHRFSQYSSPALTIYGAQEHNLKNINVTIPTQQLVVMTGVSGSGKSTLLFDIVDKAARQYFYNASEIPGKHSSIKGWDNFKRIVTVDQVAIGNSKSTRSNIATYTKLFDMIRDLFAVLPAAKSRGFSANTFSFNASDQRCQNCNGSSVVEVDMTFMDNIETVCPACNGMRFNEEVLAVEFKGHTIAHILDLTVNDALEVFKEEKKIVALLDLMKQIGLEHLTLGQSTSTLSGGEAQRIKLASELSKPETGSTLYLPDEPTTGLHPHEVEKLIGILKKLVSKGNTVVVIEHHLDVICQADTIIDFGPQGGSAGGTVVAQGTPQEIIANKNSLTGQALQAYVSK